MLGINLMQGNKMQLSEQLQRIYNTKSIMATLPHHLRAQVLRDCAEALQERENAKKFLPRKSTENNYSECESNEEDSRDSNKEDRE